ncbi:GntR family transcriptional regulator [Paludibacter sp. 221]|uniref:GntR family transcriptional regulator n=1 Tax=Paludibacter sp. 221 TaxID=2302939 RepID=UPI0013D4B15E|nr:GntR family transcriptional regulator [Paludibacter sp. 221]NDV45903.1 GntR family transcriptional regulator [Paludibacter sp. 221]
MNFKDNKAIYLQIAERICDEILLGTYKEDERIPSVREYASMVEVNFNTVMRSFEHLQSSDIVYNKRGIGYFVANGAKAKILSIRKNDFLQNEINDFFKQVQMLDIPMEKIVEMYNQYVKQQKNKQI